MREPNNQVLSVLIWNLWDQGGMQEVGAIGVVMVLVLMLITILMRRFAFGSGRHIQQASS